MSKLMASLKKRKISEEMRKFQEKWTNDYLFVEVKNKPICLICLESVSAFKEFNIKRHYTSKHLGYDKFKGDIQD